MRLSEHERHSIAQVVKEKDRDARIYLFGSRGDDTARGGDIDLLIISKTLNGSDKIDIKPALYDEIGEQKIDVVIARDTSKPFTRIALSQGVSL